MERNGENLHPPPRHEVCYEKRQRHFRTGGSHETPSSRPCACPHRLQRKRRFATECPVGRPGDERRCQPPHVPLARSVSHLQPAPSARRLLVFCRSRVAREPHLDRSAPALHRESAAVHRPLHSFRHRPGTDGTSDQRPRHSHSLHQRPEREKGLQGGKTPARAHEDFALASALPRRGVCHT